MFHVVRSLVIAGCIAAILQPAPVAAQVGPQSVSDLVVRGVNVQQVTPACTPDLEIGFLGLTAPVNKVLLLTGLFWGASSQPGFTVEADLYVTNGTPSNRQNIGRVSGTTGADGNFSGIQAFPVPLPMFRGAFTHLCIHNVKSTTILGTSTFAIYGFFAAD
ncbi:MAG TPA: hypothetical protein VEK56_09925, partial [Vicinamibacterales bacterium]|nr:hypothetical protein [Vicinamibacterales bacterium]